MPGLATIVAVSFVVLPAAALGPHSFKGFISKSFLFLLLLPLLTSHVLIFQVF